MGDKLKALFQGKRGKWFMAAAAVVVILGFVALRNRSSGAAGVNLSEYPTYTNASDGSAAGGVTEQEVQEMVGSLSRDFSAAIKAQQEQSTKQVQQYADSLAGTQTAFAQMFSGYTAQTQAKIDELNASLLQRAQTQVSTSYQQPIVDDSDRTVYSSSNPYSGNAATGYAQPTYGYGGVDYSKADTATKKAIEANEARLKSDSSFVESEKARTAKVIEDRKAAGKDISEQLAYQQKLNKAG